MFDHEEEAITERSVVPSRITSLCFQNNFSLDFLEMLIYKNVLGEKENSFYQSLVIHKLFYFHSNKVVYNRSSELYLAASVIIVSPL